MLRVDRYIMQRFMAGVIPAMLLLLALFSFIALAEELEDVGQGSFTLADALMVVFLTTPKRIVELLPVTALLGGLLGLGAMANHRELIAIRTIGISKQRIAQTIAALALLLGAFITILQFSVVPGFERDAARLRGQTLQNTDIGTGSSKAIWTRNADSYIHVNGIQSDRTLTGIEIYSTDGKGRLTGLIQAASAFPAGQENWQLTDVLESTFDGLPLEALAPSDLVKIISNLKRNQLDTHHYEVVFWQQVSLLPGLLAMALLSLPFLLGSVRSVSASQRAIIGGLIGIGFYLLQQLSGHLAGLLGLNPSIVLLTPPFVLLLIAVAAIRHRNL
jgi:lipopolysaccharide export system permease protein